MTRRDWYEFKRVGPCEVCRKRGRRQAHHVVREQDLPDEFKWDIRNRLLLGIYCGCHSAHHQFGVRDTRISYARVPEAAKDFASEVLGEERASEYFRRYYREAP